MRALERFLLLQIIDQRWREHLHDMDYLREGIHLRGLAQLDPLVAYKNEAFTLFGDLMNLVWMRLRADDLPRPGDGRRRIRPQAPPPMPARSAEPAVELVDRRRPRELLGRRWRRPARRRWPRPRRRRSRRRWLAEADAGGRAGGAAAPRRRQRAGPQRPVLVRVGQEVQEVPRRVAVWA